MFVLYNRYVGEGYRVNIEVNEDDTGLRLDVDDGVGATFVRDIPKMLDKAFAHIRLEGITVYCDDEAFVEALMEEL